MRKRAITSTLAGNQRLRAAAPARCPRLCSRPLIGYGSMLLAVSLLALPRPAFCAVGPHAGHGHTTQRAPGYLGVEFHDLSDDQAAALHLRKPHGVEILLVDHDGPAGQAGLQPRDIITGLNGNVVTSGETLRRMIHDAGAGVDVVLDIFRSGHTITIRTKLANREEVERRAWARVTAPDPPPARPSPVAAVEESYSFEPAPSPAHGNHFMGSILHGPSTGLMLEGMQPQLRIFFGAPKAEGLLVQAVEAGSPAANAGVAAADVITRADGVPLRNPSDWTKHLHSSKGKPINLTVVRQHHELSLTMQPEGRK